MTLKTAEEVRKLMPFCLTIEDKLESIMYQIEEAVKHGHWTIVTKSFHDGNEMKELTDAFRKLGFKAVEYGFNIHISWDK